MLSGKETFRAKEQWEQHLGEERALCTVVRGLSSEAGAQHVWGKSLTWGWEFWLRITAWRGCSTVTSEET